MLLTGIQFLMIFSLPQDANFDEIVPPCTFLVHTGILLLFDEQWQFQWYLVLLQIAELLGCVLLWPSHNTLQNNVVCNKLSLGLYSHVVNKLLTHLMNGLQ